MKLIPNWRDWWRLWSVRIQLGAFALLGAWEAMPGDLKASIAPEWVQRVAMGLLVLGVLSRVVHQPALDKPKDPQ